jgi:hypothetical protein
LFLKTLGQLEEYESKCREWHEEALGALNEAQTVEYHRLVKLFEATKYWYRGVLANSVEESKKLKKERGYFWGLGFLALLLLWYFSDSDSPELKIIFALFLLLGFYNENNGKILDREIAAEIRQISRDLSLTGMVLTETYKIIQKEQQIDKVWNSDRELDEETKGRAILEGNILQYYWREKLLGVASGHKLNTSLPLSASEIID